MSDRVVSISQTGIDMAQIEQTAHRLKSKIIAEGEAETKAWTMMKSALAGIANEIAGLVNDCDRIAGESEARRLANLAALAAFIGTEATVKGLQPGGLTEAPPDDVQPQAPPAPTINRRRFGAPY